TRCLAKESNQRYQRAGEVRAGLESIRAGVAAVTPHHPPTRLGVRPLLWAAAAVLTVVLAVSLYWFFAVRGPIRSVAILPSAVAAQKPSISVTGSQTA